jgi:hypothetical protein
MAVCSAAGNPFNPVLLNMDAAAVNCSGVSTLGIILPSHHLSRQRGHVRKCQHYQLQ